MNNKQQSICTPINYLHKYFNNCILKIFKNVWNLENKRNAKRLTIPEYF